MSISVLWLQAPSPPQCCLAFWATHPILTEWDVSATIGLYNTVHKSSLCECTFDKIYLFICKHLIINLFKTLARHEMSGVTWLESTHTLVCRVLPVLSSGREYFLNKGWFCFGTFFVKMIQTSLHDDVWGGGGGVTRFGCTWVHLGLHLKCACVFIHNLQ